MRQYHDLLQHVLDHGVRTDDRTGTGTRAVFGTQTRYALDPSLPNPDGSPGGFPLVTTKKIHTRSVFVELLWFLRGDTNIRFLHDHGVTIWDEWADDQGDLGPVYGAQWRSWPNPDGSTTDQIARLVADLGSNPHSRRHIVCAWNPGQVDQMALPPCHSLFQFHVAPAGDGGPHRLSCQLYQRSADLFLGVPFNIASYALLTMMLAQVCGYRPGEFIHTIGDAHIYLNHEDQVREQLARTHFPLPTLSLDPSVNELDGFRLEHIELVGYEHHAAIRAPVAV